MTIALFLLVGSIGAVIALLTSLSAAALSYVALAARASGSSARVVLRKVFARMHYPLIASLSVAITLKYVTTPSGWATLLPSIGATAGVFCAVFYAMGATGEERRVLRRIVARVVPPMIIEGARSTWYLLIAMREAVRGTPGRVRAAASADYDRTVDPWGYSTQWGTEHLRKTDLLLDCALEERALATACEVGCGEGFISERVAARVHQVLALDISSVALKRARDRCATLDGIQFGRWDLLTDAPPGVFDLVLAMGVLECFTRPSHLWLALDKIGQMMAPRGYLLATTTRQHRSIEESRWAAFLVRGTTQMHRFVLRYSSLEAVAEEWTSTHHFALYRKKRQRGERG
jgi:2-polyprenyl-3-methyl-5-hydroxy-6-metoxy-1,4-benzoquinol methylase